MTLSSSSPRCIALIPAAGSGQRLGGSLPKQYQRIGTEPMLVHTLRALEHPSIIHRYIVLAPEDQYFESHCASRLRAPYTPLYVGASSRAGSVLAGLNALPAEHAQDWVWVHDAARPCLHPKDVEQLLEALTQGDPTHEQGWILSQPVADTLKRASTPHATTLTVHETVSREALWQAQTPQIACVATLIRALEHAAHDYPDTAPTDEAQALEWHHIPVHLVPALHPNFKVTYPSDQSLAHYVLDSYLTHE
jgi:2-C-methyl-D-erythritol 4-phosphate cytidylyltransferase